MDRSAYNHMGRSSNQPPSICGFSNLADSRQGAGVAEQQCRTGVTEMGGGGGATQKNLKKITTHFFHEKKILSFVSF